MKLSEGLTRQRRNLIIISGVLFMLKFGEVKINKLSVASIDFTFNNPNAIYVALWLMFVYFFIRYFQYTMEESNEEMNNLYFKEMDRITAEPIAQLLSNQYMEEARNHPEIMPLVEMGTPPKFYCEPYSKLRRREGILYGNAKRHLSGMHPQDIPIELKEAQLLRYKQFVVLKLCFHYTLFTDIAFPFLIAITAFFYAGLGGWQGAIGNVVSVTYP